MFDSPVSIATYIAVAIVCVFPGILPANIKVAPNSPQALVKPRMPPVKMDLDDKGMITFVNVFHSVAPSTFAAPIIF